MPPIKKLTKEQFESLYEISRSLNRAVYEDSLVENVIDIVINEIDAERALFVKYDASNKNFALITARNFQQENITDLSEFSSGVLQKIVKDKKPVLFHDVQSDPQISQFESIQIQKIKSVVGVPIKKDDEVWGIILADSQRNRKEFTEDNLLFLDFFSNLVSLALERIVNLEKLRDENLLLMNQLEANPTLPDIIGESEPMRKLSKLIHKVAQSNATVLIQGESGTGKELVAHAVHKLSGRSKKPFVAQFCGSIPDNLLESELFGYKKGAFTGANTDKKGLLEVANEGTFFLDEIADISPAVQAKLLRVIENREIIRLGDTVIRKVNIRIIAATNKNLETLVRDGKFREDLFYRLNVFPVKLPPLRERRGDIPLIANHYIKKFAGRHIPIDPEALSLLENYYWPGNVRQLINVLHRASILCDTSKILKEHIVLEDERDIYDFMGSLSDFEKILIRKRLEFFKGNKTKTAESLNISRRMMHMKIKEYGLDF